MILTATFTPRLWQSRGLDNFTKWVSNRRKGDSRTFTAAITGAAGKTHWGSMIANYLMLYQDFDTVVVIAPSNTILNQWYKTLSGHGIEVTNFRSGEIVVPANNGIITTYKMLENNYIDFRRVVNKKTLVIFDECHHLANSRMWGMVASELAQNAGYRLMLTGTPFREDDAQIPYVTYKNGQLVTNFEYTYGEALKDGYVRPIYFRSLDADATWRVDADTKNAMLLSSTSISESQRSLRTAINPKSFWIRYVIETAHAALIKTRTHMPNAAAIITCANQDHARKTQRLIQKLTHTNPVLAISDDPDSDEKIEHFRDSDTEWLVVVRKGSEGLDIPRLCVGVWATNITKQLSFLQFMYRIIRQGSEPQQAARFYMPAHPKLIEYAQSVREMRVHVISPPEEEPIIKIQGDKQTEASLGFEPISAAVGETTKIDISSEPEDTLNLLIKIREFAAAGIDGYARQQAEIFLNVSLHDIRELLNIPEPITPIKQSRTPAQEYEYQRQWKTFVLMFNQVKSLNPWYRDVLSLLETKGVLSGEEIARIIPFVSKSAFGTNRVRDNGLLRLWLIKYSNKKYHSRLEEHLEAIAPLHNTETLIGYLLTGTLPEKP